MAYSTTKVDLYRGSSNVSSLLPKQLSDEIWAKAVEESAVMQLAQQIAIPGTGVTIPVITGDATADWVGETEEKHVSEASLNAKVMTPYKVAVIELFSNEFKRDLPRVYEELARRLPSSIGKKFDETVFAGTAPGSNFDVLTNSTAVNIQSTANSGTVYKNLVSVLSTVAAADDAELTGWAFSPKADAILLGAVDTTGRPIFVPNANEGSIGSILGAPVYRTRRAYKQGLDNDVLGFAGDWSQAYYGVVDGINVAISEEATINDGSKQINLWQRNMFAIRVEAELGFVVKNSNAFVKVTGTATGSTGATS